MEDVSRSGSGQFRALFAVAGAICSAGMCLGALGPWIETPVISFDGWAGLGFPLVIVAFAVFAIQILHAFIPRRRWLVVSLLLAVLTLICAIALALLASLLSHGGTFLAVLVARGAHRDLLRRNAVSIGWGIPVLSGASAALMAVCITGLLGRSTWVGLPRLQRASDRPEVTPASPEGPIPDDDEASWFKVP